MFIAEENLAEIADLEQQLLEFYDNTKSYPVYERTSWRPEYWSIVIQQMKKANGENARILEIGAAKSGFAEYLKSVGESPSVAFQDITKRCKSHLKEYTDELYFCPVEKISGTKFDIIFHSYVFEHVTRPKTFLDSIGRLLTERGRHIIESPRYDIPFYIPPAIRHINKREKIEYIAKSLLDLYPDFAVVKDPAIFHRAFRRDYDAVNRVTLKSIRKYANESGYRLQNFDIGNTSLLQNIVEKNLRLRVILYRV